ncbi:pentatricopeptide repeat protein [Hirsutella rhossiliensis]|uniref:Pentatricopeptide repeat protein n=1 Tax=Hirsutella rhossiliensis TaxID=111463 RepID=A0A9P8N487_9HYPO|nr:pentatricopeptide repeat protein [Hirsutella rhossiliensis]KAH0966307.1 pentatricopeptide repeat protein [Hirsutella rhossiliensis]
MKIPSRVDGSVRGALLFNCSSASVRNVQASKRSFASNPPRSSPSRPAACAKSSTWLLSTFAPPVEARCVLQTPRPRRARHSCYSTASAAACSPVTPALPGRKHTPTQDRQYLLSLVYDEDEASVDDCIDFHRDPYRRGYASPDGPRLRVSDKSPDVQYPTHDETFRIDNDTRQILVRLYTAVGQRLRHPSRVSLESICKLYSLLPEPRMLHITWQWRNRLMRVMGTPRKRDMESMLRYFALVADVKDAGLTLRRSQWNFALAFAAKYASRTTAREMESTLRLWREMEREANVPGNEVTFNILFDVAAKAGNFALADMIYQEMESRGIEYNRFHHVSLIHYFGLKLDSGGIRAAYREMVESGEMIDTVVLNCVISGLLRCGEEGPAEETYERMKNNHTLAPALPQRDYMMSKVITKVIMMFSKVSKKHPELKETLQTTVHLSPDLHTYKLLVQHYAIRVGNLNRVVKYLDEMKFLKVPVHPTIFLALFKGFYMHGGFPGSDWSEPRLDGLLSALYHARDTHAKNFPIDRWLVIWALRAVKKCSSAEALEETFDAMVRRWDVPADRQPFMHALYENILQGRDMRSPSGNWDEMTHRRSKRDGSWL